MSNGNFCCCKQAVELREWVTNHVQYPELPTFYKSFDLSTCVSFHFEFLTRVLICLEQQSKSRH